jgi:hypothetical protein
VTEPAFIPGTRHPPSASAATHQWWSWWRAIARDWLNPALPDRLLAKRYERKMEHLQKLMTDNFGLGERPKQKRERTA